MFNMDIQSEIENLSSPEQATKLPLKSAKMYEKLYMEFMNWKDQNKASSFSEDVLIVYFEELSTKWKSSTLWRQYSILKSMLSIKNNTDISSYAKLHALLKNKSKGYKPKKSKTFSTNQIEQFITEAPDVKYLLSKAVCIFGIMGACRRNELHKLEFTDVNDFNTALLVTIKDNQSKTTRKFTITGKYFDICKKYINLRPKDCTSPAFFVNYFNGKCTGQNVGINKFGNMGKEIASYLKLPEPNLYTGHCFCRTSATILVDDTTSIKSTALAENYIDELVQNKINKANQLLNSIEYSQTNNFININPSTSRMVSTQKVQNLPETPQFHFAYVCSLHFEDKFIQTPWQQKLLGYSPKNIRILKADAVPTINLPGRLQKKFDEDETQNENFLDTPQLVNIKEEPIDSCENAESSPQPIKEEYIDPFEHIEIKGEYLDTEDEKIGEKISLKFAKQCFDYAIKYLKQCTETNLDHRISFLEDTLQELPMYK